MDGVVSKIKLRCEIITALTIKLILLSILWKLCFAHPVGNHLKKANLAHHFFNLTLTMKDKNASH